MKKFIIALVLSVAAACSLSAGTPEENLREGIRYHDLARLDPAVNIQKGKELLFPLIKESVVAKGYYGSLVTLEASEFAKNKNGIKALSLLSEGTGMIDDAVKQSPNLADLHFLRMVNSYEVSQGSPMNRYKMMKNDIDWIGPRVSQFDSVNQGVFHLYKGLYDIKARKPEEALASFDACIAVSPGSPEAAEAEKQKGRYAE